MNLASIVFVFGCFYVVYAQGKYDVVHVYLRAAAVIIEL